MKLINLTPHEIGISGHGTIPVSGQIARVNTQLMQIGNIDGIPMMVTRNMGLCNVPAPQPDTMYIVAGMVRMQLPERKDLCSPSKLLRNEHGAVVACAALEVNA